MPRPVGEVAFERCWGGVPLSTDWVAAGHLGLETVSGDEEVMIRCPVAVDLRDVHE